MTSAYIRTNPSTFSDFLLSPTTFLPLTPEEFCRQEVEPVGKEADHAQIMALAETLQVGIRVAYLDRSDVGNGEVINWVEFGPGTKEEQRPLTLLYRSVDVQLIDDHIQDGGCISLILDRPGHFDVVAKDVLPEGL